MVAMPPLTNASAGSAPGASTTCRRLSATGTVNWLDIASFRIGLASGRVGFLARVFVVADPTIVRGFTAPWPPQTRARLPQAIREVRRLAG
jgi:hypothetical protein